MAHERNCICCGTSYEYCPRCKVYLFEDTWKALYCNENCRGIYKILEAHRAGRIEPFDAQEQLNTFDLSRKEQFNGVLKAQIEEIFSAPKIKSHKKTKDDEIEIQELNPANCE